MEEEQYTFWALQINPSINLYEVLMNLLDGKHFSNKYLLFKFCLINHLAPKKKKEKKKR